MFAAAGWCAALLALTTNSPAEPGVEALVINEIFYRGSESDLEYVELFNGSSRYIDLAEIQISDNRRRPVPISESTSLMAPGGYAVLVRESGAFDTRWAPVDRIEVASWPALNNGGDTVILWAGDAVLDSVKYTSSWGGDDAALERIDPAGSSLARTNWAESLDRSGGTPGSPNSVFAPDKTPPRPTFAEEREDGSLSIHFSEPLNPSTVRSASFRLNTGEIPSSVQLVEDGTTVILHIGGPISGAGSAAASVSVMGVSDESGNAVSAAEVEISWLPGPGEVLINELMFEPLADDFDGLPDQPEYVELFAVSARVLSLRSLTLTDQLDEEGHRDTTLLTDRRLQLRQGMYAVIYAQPDPEVDPLSTFPALDRTDPGIILLPISRSSLSLGNNGDYVRLERFSGTLVDDVEYSSGWHLAEVIETRGRSLERISVEAASWDPSNWTTSVDRAGGTPGTANSVRLGVPNPTGYSFVSVDPSPFSPDGDGFEDATSIHVDIGNPTAVLRAWIFDLEGREVVELVQAQPASGRSTLIWNGRNRDGKIERSGIFIVLVEAVDTGSGYVRSGKAPVALARP